MLVQYALVLQALTATENSWQYLTILSDTMGWNNTKVSINDGEKIVVPNGLTVQRYTGTKLYRHQVVIKRNYEAQRSV